MLVLVFLVVIQGMAVTVLTVVHLLQVTEF
jgi:hypothetical protein